MRKNVIFGFVSGFDDLANINFSDEDYFWEGPKEQFWRFFPKSDGIIHLSINNILASKYNSNSRFMRIITTERHSKKIVFKTMDNTPLNDTIYSTVIIIDKKYLYENFPLNRNTEYGWNLVEVHFKGLIYLMKNNFDKKAIEYFMNNLDHKNISLFILLSHYFGIADTI